MEKRKEYECCKLCPRMCSVDRYSQRGYCGCGPVPHVAKVMLHRYEEPVLTGDKGLSGAVFFAGCSLGCVYCQNKDISRIERGRSVDYKELSKIFLELEKKGAENIDIITADHYSPDIIDATLDAKHKGLSVPVIYNCSGYQRHDMVKELSRAVDIFLFDYKYIDKKTAFKYSRASDYGDICDRAINMGFQEKGALKYDSSGKLLSGILVRHMLLPDALIDAKRIVKKIYDNYGDDIIISLMSQYTPMGTEYPKIERKVSEREYRSLVLWARSMGVKNALVQDLRSAEEAYIPDF